MAFLLDRIGGDTLYAHIQPDKETKKKCTLAHTFTHAHMHKPTAFKTTILMVLVSRITMYNCSW